MAHPKDDEVYPVGTVIRLLDTNEFATIIGHTFLSPGNKNFLHYLGDIEGRKGEYCIHHDRIELEALPE